MLGGHSAHQNKNNDDMENWEVITYGVTIIPVSVCGILVLFISIYKIVRILGSNDTSTKYLNAIWLLGLFALLLRVFGQLMYLSDMFYAISSAEVPDLPLMAKGLGNAMLYPLSGLGILIMSLIFWGLIKALPVLNTRKT